MHTEKIAQPAPHEDTAKQNAAEAASLVYYQGWDVEAAAAFVGISSQAAERCLRRGPKLPYMPTPEEITEQCERFRAISPRRMVGPQLPALIVRRYRASHTETCFSPADHE